MTNEPSVEQSPVWNANLRPFEHELTKERAQDLITFGRWWGDRLIATSNELIASTELEVLKPNFGLPNRYFTLLTHHTKNEASKAGIIELGGLIYWPDSQATQFFGSQAAVQLRCELGDETAQASPYGKQGDGLTFAYLHPIDPLLYDDAHVYREGPEGLIFARTFAEPGNRPNYGKSRAALEYEFQAPWVGLDTWLTEEPGLSKLKELLPQYKDRLDADPKFAGRLHMTENKYLIGII